MQRSAASPFFGPLVAPLLASAVVDVTASIPHGSVLEIDPQAKTLRVV